MRPVSQFTVQPRLPGPLEPLQELAENLRWTWHRPARDLFRRLVDEGGEVHRNGGAGLVGADGAVNPLLALARAGRERLDALAADPGYVAQVAAQAEALDAYQQQRLWFQTDGPPGLGTVAYFSPEFGISEAIPQYSGGLGVLAGDHLKAASDLGVPLVGVGLLYAEGYFRQELDESGWQRERYVALDPELLGLRPVAGLEVQVELAGRPLAAQAWRASIGRVRLYLLDTDVPANPPDLRRLTDRLYGGDMEHRLCQEILRGVGGIRALRGAGEAPTVFHTNEGHAGFLGLERIQELVVGSGLSFDEAVEAVRSATVFTTHTPVPAGIDRFPVELMRRYFAPLAEACGIPFARLMAIGHHPDEPEEAPFNMAVMGLRLAGHANAVSRLHQAVSRTLFGGLWPEVPAAEVPIGGITNGVHPRSWVAEDVDRLLTQHLGPDWDQATAERWAGLAAVPDQALWSLRESGRGRLVAAVRARLRASQLAVPSGGGDLAWWDEVLDPSVCTIGFARRVAEYKRATLLLSDPGRLTRLLTDPTRPVQLVFAGKAHPADEVGKRMIQELVRFAADPAERHRIVFLEDYGIDLARALYQGADVWLNTPRRQQEACGTSGEKAALGGGLNCSIRDGWWDEGFDGENGWAIPSADPALDPAERDRREAAELFSVLEDRVVPLFYARDGGGVPAGWVARVRHALMVLGPFVNAARMVREYVEASYAPAERRGARLAADGFAVARDLAAWKANVRACWPQLRIEGVRGPEAPPALGARAEVEARVALAGLRPSELQVELVHGAITDGGEIDNPGRAPMALVDPEISGDGARYRGRFVCDRAGPYGFTVRATPVHPELASPLETGCIAWALPEER